jgi:acyl-[acyl carrier protein]--UDP-N-acetylglucosamine O-acyltransferase
MKKLLITTLFIPFYLYAQEGFQQEIINQEALTPAFRYENLDRTAITSGNLINRSLVLSDHTAFYKDSTGVNNYSGWQQLYEEIQTGFFDKNALPFLDSIRYKVNQYQAQNITPILMLDVSYQQIKNNALADSLLTLNADGIFEDVFPRVESPYETHRVISFSPAINGYYTNQITFLISQEFFFSNNDLPDAIEIDFADGNGFQQVQWGNSYTINYNDTLTKNLSFRIIHNNDSSTAFSRLSLLGPCNSCLFFDLLNQPDDFGSIGGLIPAFGATGVIDYYIKSNAPSGSANFLDKPFIIVEGLDFDDPECSSLYKNGSVGWCTLWGQGGIPEFDLAPNLLNGLLAQGYDIIMIDYQDGATYIERNAFALVEFLKYLNNVRNAGPSVIVGTSMGGLVSRYALSYMEKNNIPHCNRLWVSVDSPQQGANIPVGMQAFLEYFSTNGPGFIKDPIKDNFDNLNEPAPKQLLTKHINGINGNETTERLNFAASIAALGYPQKTRKIAMSNGSRFGSALGMQPGEKVFDWRIPAQFLGCGQLSNRAEIWAKHHNGSGRVFKGSIIDGLAVNLCALTSVLCNACVNQFSTTYSYFFNGGPSYDRMPGGRRTSYKDIKDNVQVFGLSAFIGDVRYEDHCFIPTKSALDLNGSIDFFSDLDNIDIIDKENPNDALLFSPFEKLWAADGSSVISNSPNELHVELTPGNINWLIREACAGEPNVGSMLTATYNFARPENRFLYDVNIASGGNLLVNAQQLSDFGVNTCVPAVLPIPGPTFVLETSDCMSFLEISNGGNMQIGDNTAGNAAKVIIHSGVEVILRTGSKLMIHNNSTLIIEKGAKLIYEPGAVIQLLGDEAVLELQGELEVKDNATFTFTYPNANSGYLKFNVPFNPCQSNPNWACPVITAGQNSKMELRGAHKNDKILEIAGEDMLIPEDMAFFRLWFGKAEFTTPGARLSLASTNYRLTDATFVGTVNNRGVVVWGNPNSFIVRCNFENVKIWGGLWAKGNRLNVFTSNFTNGAYVETTGRGVLFNDVNFNRTASYIQPTPTPMNGWINNFSDVPSVYSKGNITTLNAAASGIANHSPFTSTTLNEVAIKEGGIASEGGTLLMKCSKVENSASNNVIDGIIYNESQLRMSSIDGNGFNKITGSSYNINGFNTHLLDIELGYNDFSNGVLAAEFPLPAPTTIAGNANQYFQGAGMGAGTPDPNTTSEYTQPPYLTQYKKAMFYEQFWGCNGTITASNCIKIPVQWQFLPNQPPIPSCGSTGGGGTTLPTGTVSPLAVCGTCPMVNSAYFSNKPLNEAILEASSYMELTDTTQNDVTAVGLFYEIFSTTTIDYNDYNQSFLTKYGYSNMKNALQNCFATGRIKESHCVPTLDNSVEQLIQVINLQKQPVTAQNVSTQFYLSLDEALVFRLIGQRDAAITKLEAIDNCYLTDKHRTILKNTIAATKIERDAINKTIPLMAAVDLLNQIQPLKTSSGFSKVDTTSTVHPSATIGKNVTLGANVTIEQGVVINAYTTIADNVVIKKNSIIGEHVIIDENTIIEKEVEIGNFTVIGSYTIIKQNTTIGEHTTVNDSIVIEKDVTIYDYVDIENKVLIKKETTIGSGAFIGENAIINKEIIIGELAVIRENAEINDKVKVGNKNIIAKETKVKNKTETGKEVLVEENMIIPANKKICDNENVNLNFNFSNICNTNISHPVLVSNANSCAFAMGYAQTRTNFLNGFKLSSDVKLLTDEAITFIPNNLSSFYNWEFGDCGTSTDEQAIYTFRKPGIYLVKLTQGTTCDTVVYYGAVTVFPNPKSEIDPTVPECLADEDVRLNRETIIDLSQPSCIPTADCTPFIPLKAENCRLKLIWDFDNDSIKEETIALNDTNLTNGNIAVQYDTNKVFTTSLVTTIENREETHYKWEKACEKDTATAEITINNSFKISMTATGCAPGEIQFTSNTFGGVAPFTYFWNFGKGLTSSHSSPLITVADTGMLSVELIITDANNCVSHLLSAVYISDCNANARTSGNDNAESTTDGNNKTTLTDNDEVKVYPNPTAGQVIFEYSLKENNAQIVITDLMGKVVSSVKINGDNKTKIDLSKFPKGIYLYKVIGQTKVISSDKIILME